MSLPELFLLAVGLSMDAFAVSVCKGLSLSRVEIKHMFLAGLYFGGFQAGMPALGYLLGLQFQDAIVAVDHWIAFFLLGFIGLDMVKDAVGGKEEALDNSFAAKTMVALAVATSIDALAVGITFAFLNIHIAPAVVFIGITTFLLSVCGVKAGNVCGNRFGPKAELIGGMILIGIGLKILIEHLVAEGGIFHG